MARGKSLDEPRKTIRRRRATTPEEREKQIIAAAYDLAEERILNGTASSQEVTFFLKLGSTKEKLEKDILEKQKELISAKTDALQSAKHIEELYANAIASMKIYSGQDDSNEDSDV